MDLVKAGIGVGGAMMVFGFGSTIIARGRPKSDPNTVLMDEGGGSFIVFGAVVVGLSLAYEAATRKSS